MAENQSGNSGTVSIFAMVLLTIVVLVILYFVVYKGFFNKKTEVDVNINPKGSFKMLGEEDLKYCAILPPGNVFKG